VSGASSTGEQVAVTLCELGPLGVWSGGEWRAVSGERTAAIVAQLSIAGASAVPTSLLIERTWLSAERPSSARQSLANIIGRLRSSSGADFVETTGSGYRLGCHVRSDRSEFLDALDKATSVHETDPAGALCSAIDALERWRDEPWKAMEVPEGIEADRAFLIERRLDGVQLVADAYVADDRLADAIGQLRELVQARPLTERNWVRLAEHESSTGSRTDALRRLQGARAALVDVGLEPGDDFRALERSLLDPTARLDKSVPEPASPLVGRQVELDGLRQRVRRQRLVSLVGTGGVGKTRLAVEFAAEHSHEHVTFVDLASIRIGGLCAATTATAVGAGIDASRTDVERVITKISDYGHLVIFDNCEHVRSDVATLISDLLEACPRLRVVTTSRQRLGIRPEYVMRLTPLDTAPGGPAVDLFFQRSAAAGVALEREAWRQDVAQVCATLDGLPLAIELAAARTTIFNPFELRSRIENRFELLRAPAISPRHDSLADAIAWSWDDLDDDERSLLTQLAVFVRPPAFDDITETRPDREHVATLDLLDQLVEKSLLSTRTDEQRTSRFVVLDSVRQFTLDAAERANTLAGYADAHLQWVDQKTRQAVGEDDLEATGPHNLLLLDEIEHDMRAALDHAAASGDRVQGLHVCIRTFNWWRGRGAAREGCERLGELDTNAAPHALRIEAMAARAILARISGANKAVKQLVRDGRDGLAEIPAEHRTRLELRLLEADFDASDQHLPGRLRAVIDAAQQAGTHEDAIALHLLTAWTITNAPADAAERATETYAASLNANAACLAHATELQGLAQLAIGNPAGASEHLADALNMLQELGQRFCALHCCESIAWFAAQTGRTTEATTLLGASEALRLIAGRTRAGFELQAIDGLCAIIGRPPEPDEALDLDQIVAAATDVLATL
jgi:predicted ATPase/DNA-binding SARP family transcriptional activator